MTSKKALIKECLRILKEEDQCDDIWDVACVALRQLTERLQEQLDQLYSHGPTWDGDVISKSDRDALLELGLAARVCRNGEFGYTACTYLGGFVRKAGASE
jgi:hypothetical protein